MKIVKRLLALSLLPFSLEAQNLPQCDSLLIDCCTFGNGSLTIQASNYTSELFDYPGFILFNSDMDTIAKETVTYFGIGQGFQPHTMNVVAPLNLPFTGFLNLYSWFYDSLDCSFPFTISDTLASGITGLNVSNDLLVYPNPSNGIFTIVPGKQGKDVTVTVWNLVGEIIFEKNYEMKQSVTVNINAAPGLYLAVIKTSTGNMERVKVIKD